MRRFLYNKVLFDSLERITFKNIFITQTDSLGYWVEDQPPH